MEHRIIGPKFMVKVLSTGQDRCAIRQAVRCKPPVVIMLLKWYGGGAQAPVLANVFYANYIHFGFVGGILTRPFR